MQRTFFIKATRYLQYKVKFRKHRWVNTEHKSKMMFRVHFFKWSNMPKKNLKLNKSKVLKLLRFNFWKNIKICCNYRISYFFYVIIFFSKQWQIKLTTTFKKPTLFKTQCTTLVSQIAFPTVISVHQNFEYLKNISKDIFT